VKVKKIVGFILAKPYEDSRTRFYINWVAVSPTLRGLGIGTKMIDKVVAIAHKFKFRTIVIDTGKDNMGMQTILQRNGFQPIDAEIYFVKKLPTVMFGEN
jgi:ribosomal protein S18 acetylase RimI-like enzyme